MPDTDPTDLRAVGDRIEHLLAAVRSHSDDRTWDAVAELVRLLTELYGAGLELALRLGGPDLATRLAGDELGAGLLLLHGLHPESVEARAASAVEHVAGRVRRAGGDVQLSSVSSGEVRVTLTVAGGCGSTADTLRDTVTAAMWEAVPDATSVQVDVSAPPAVAPVRLGPTRLAAR